MFAFIRQSKRGISLGAAQASDGLSEKRWRRQARLRAQGAEHPSEPELDALDED